MKYILISFLTLILFASTANANLTAQKKCLTYELFVEIVDTKDNGIVETILDYKDVDAVKAYNATGGNTHTGIARFVLSKLISKTNSANYGYMINLFNAKKCSIGYAVFPEDQIDNLKKAMEEGKTK